MERGRDAPLAALVDDRESQHAAEHELDSEAVRRRGRRGPGVSIIPSRVRQARTERGLSLADLAGSEVSRAFIHQLEQGLARPSLQILELVAHRTGKPVTYFTSGELQAGAGPDLSSDLVATSKRLERLASTLELSEANREAFRLIVNSLRHGARLVTAVTRERGGSAGP
jgi:transcriptional regulator with XRE-family HTH domain